MKVEEILLFMLFILIFLLVILFFIIINKSKQNTKLNIDELLRNYKKELDRVTTELKNGAKEIDKIERDIFVLRKKLRK